MKALAKKTPRAVNQTKAATTGDVKAKVPVTTKDAKAEPDALAKAEEALKTPKYEQYSGDTPIPTTEDVAPSNLGDWDQNGKAGGDAKAIGKEPRPMPKDFKLETTREGNTIVARQDGIEVPFRFTEDKDEYAAREEQQRQDMWTALEGRRVKALG